MYDMKIRTILIEDIESERRQFKDLLEKNFPEFEVIGESDNIDVGYFMIHNQKPDVVFFDINLQIGTGFDLLNKCLEEKIATFEIVFLTGETNRDYPVRAIHYSALDFIYKPVELNKLVECIDRIKEKIKQKKNSIIDHEQLKVLIQHLLPQEDKKDKRVVFHRTSGVKEIVRPDEILYCESAKDTTFVYLTNCTSFYAMNNLSFYSKLLTIDYNFFRISDTILINLDKLIRIHPGENIKIELSNEIFLIASRRRGRELKHYLEQQIKQNELIIQTNEKTDIFSVFRKIFGIN